MRYLAHSKEGAPEDQWQTIFEHAEGAAKLCTRFSSLWCEEAYARDLGILHDIGKYQEDFQKRIRGERALHVEHSICGAVESEKYRLFGADYCIAGHHGGLPDVGTKLDPPDETTLLARKKRKIKLVDDRRSHPAWGAWIEIHEQRNRRVKYHVAPRMGCVD